MTRALSERISHVSATLPAPFALHVPHVLSTSLEFASSRELVEYRVIESAASPANATAADAAGGVHDAELAAFRPTLRSADVIKAAAAAKTR